MSWADQTRKPGRPAERRPRWRRVAIPAFRVALLAAALFSIHRVHTKRQEMEGRVLDEIRFLDPVRAYLPAAVRFDPPSVDERLTPVLNSAGETIGWAAQTSPEAHAVMGYAGPSNLLVVLGVDRRVLGTCLIGSADTAGHVAKIEADERFFSQWNGKPVSSLGARSRPLVVGGASLTSEAIARGIEARFGGKEALEWFPGELEAKDVRAWFPDAEVITEESNGEYRISPAGAERWVLRASRMGIAVRGFQGPSDVLVALEKGEIQGVSMPGSRDNEPYTLDVRDELKFADPYAGIPAKSFIEGDPIDEFIVSGASETARSVDATLREMLRRHLAPPTPPGTDPKTWIALAWITGGLLLGFTKLRGSKAARFSFAIISVLLGGLFLGLMVAQDQWLGWAKNGGAAGSSVALIALSAAALLVPAFTGKNIYCSHLCPHGAAQTLAAGVILKRFALPPKLHRLMRAVPWLTLIGLWVLAFAGSRFPLSHAEPFEIWSVGFFAILPTVIFVVGLVAAFFLPQGYCHYGCPTGALLKFLTHAPGRWTRRDSIATALVLLGAVIALIP